MEQATRYFRALVYDFTRAWPPHGLVPVAGSQASFAVVDRRVESAVQERLRRPDEDTSGAELLRRSDDDEDTSGEGPRLISESRGEASEPKNEPERTLFILACQLAASHGFENGNDWYRSCVKNMTGAWPRRTVLPTRGGPAAQLPTESTVFNQLLKLGIITASEVEIEGKPALKWTIAHGIEPLGDTVKEIAADGRVVSRATPPVVPSAEPERTLFIMACDRTAEENGVALARLWYREIVLEMTGTWPDTDMPERGAAARLQPNLAVFNRYQEWSGSEHGRRWRRALEDLGRTSQPRTPRTYQTHKHTLYGSQEGRCAGCNVLFPFRNLTVDHVIPLSKGGSDALENLQLLCGACNSTKGSGTQADLLAKLQQDGMV